MNVCWNSTTNVHQDNLKKLCNILENDLEYIILNICPLVFCLTAVINTTHSKEDTMHAGINLNLARIPSLAYPFLKRHKHRNPSHVVTSPATQDFESWIYVIKTPLDNLDAPTALLRTSTTDIYQVEHQGPLYCMP